MFLKLFISKLNGKGQVALEDAGKPEIRSKSSMTWDGTTFCLGESRVTSEGSY